MGRPKALLPWPPTGESLVLHVTGTLRDAGVGPLAVVTGLHHEPIGVALSGRPETVLANPNHADGQLSSLLLGLRWAFSSPGTGWALVTLVDVPAVRVETVRALREAAARTDALAVRPRIGAEHGHPVLWRREAHALLERADPAAGARTVMRALAAGGRVLDVDVDDSGVLRDVDTPDDYRRLVADTTPGA